MELVIDGKTMSLVDVPDEFFLFLASQAARQWVEQANSDLCLANAVHSLVHYLMREPPDPDWLVRNLVEISRSLGSRYNQMESLILALPEQKPNA